MEIESLTPAVLAIDIGATNIKMADVTAEGVLVGNVRRRPTPYPLSPERLVEWLCERIAKRGLAQVGVGFPGEFRDGHVVAPGNLSRPAGFSSDVDPELDRQWRGFPLQQALRDATGLDVRVLNDAWLAALGSIDGQGRELVLTLGTGFGVALTENGALVEIPDYGQKVFLNDRTFDEVLGDQSKAADGEAWMAAVKQAIDQLATEYDVRAVHLGGGNSTFLRASEFATPSRHVVIHGNNPPLRGAAMLFRSSGSN